MLTMLLMILMFAVFGRMFVFALRCTWGITKMALFFVFLPLIIAGLVISGIVSLIIPAIFVVILAGIIRAACA